MSLMRLTGLETVIDGWWIAEDVADARRVLEDAISKLNSLDPKGIVGFSVTLHIRLDRDTQEEQP